jgi:hypothetical protein
MKKKTAFIAILALILVTAIGINVYRAVEKKNEIRATYQQAVSDVLAGRLEMASHRLAGLINDNQSIGNTEALFKLCVANECCVTGDASLAVYMANEIQFQESPTDDAPTVAQLNELLERKKTAYQTAEARQRKQDTQNSSTAANPPTAATAPTKKPSGSQQTTDPYHASDYANEDWFYEDHYDDFADFDEAEQYWQENS